MKVELRPAAIEHAPAILGWLRDPSIAKNLGLQSEPSEEKTRTFLERAPTDASICARAIYLDGEHGGMVVLDQIDRRVQKARLHIYVGHAAARGKGAGKQALAQALRLAFDELGLHKVWLTVHARNAGAVAAYVATGFQIEGVLRDEFLLDGERINEIRMGVLASEWHARANEGGAVG